MLVGSSVRGAPHLLALGVVAVGLPVQPGEGEPGDLTRAVAVVVLAVHALQSQGGVQGGGLNTLSQYREREGGREDLPGKS